MTEASLYRDLQAKQQKREAEFAAHPVGAAFLAFERANDEYAEELRQLDRRQPLMSVSSKDPADVKVINAMAKVMQTRNAFLALLRPLIGLEP